MTDEERLALQAELSEMNLEGVNARLASLEEETRSINDVALVRKNTEIKKELLIRKKELEDLARRNAGAKDLTEGASGKTIEERTNEMSEKIYTVASPEYREAFFKQLMGRALSEEEQRALTTSGGNGVIPSSTAEELVTKMALVAPLLSEITLSRAAGIVTIGTMLSRDDAYVHAEGTNITASTDTLAYVTLSAYEFAKIVPVSKSLQTMSVNDFERWLIDAIYEDVATQIENKIINGTGTNEPGGLASITWTASTNLISTTASVTYENICTLMTYVAKGFRKNGKFLCNYTTLYTILAAIKDSNNRPIFVESMAEGTPSRLMGRELLVSDEVGDGEVYFGDFRKIFGNMNGDPTVELSEHSSFRSGLIDYRGFAMFDCKVAASRAFAKLKKN